jgi:hypothetical protein
MTNSGKHDPNEPNLWDDVRYRKPTFQALKASGWEARENLRNTIARTEPLATCVLGALDAAHTAGSLFRGVYALPLAFLEHKVELVRLPWHCDYFELDEGGRYVPNQAAEEDIERIAERLRDLGCECRRGGTFLLEAIEPREKWILQSLAVESMIAIDGQLMSIKAGDLAGALWWQTLAFENLMECQGQAQLVQLTRHLGSSSPGCIKSYYHPDAPARRVRKLSPDYLAA